MHFFFKNLYQVQGSNQPDKSHHIATHEYVTEKEQSIKKCEIYSFFFLKNKGKTFIANFLYKKERL